MENHGKTHENKPRGKLDSNLDNVIGSVVTLEIAKGELMYGRNICKNPEEYTWNKTYYQSAGLKIQVPFNVVAIIYFSSCFPPPLILFYRMLFCRISIRIYSACNLTLVSIKGCWQVKRIKNEEKDC